MPTPRQLLDRLDSRHDELIRKLDELNAQIEQALAQVGKARGDMPRSVAVAPDPAVAERIVRQAA